MLSTGFFEEYRMRIDENQTITMAGIESCGDGMSLEGFIEFAIRCWPSGRAVGLQRSKSDFLQEVPQAEFEP